MPRHLKFHISVAQRKNKVNMQLFGKNANFWLYTFRTYMQAWIDLCPMPYVPTGLRDEALVLLKLIP